MATISLDLIDDKDLVTQLQSLGITIPHASSVLDSSIGDYADQFYYKLLVMEAYTYDHSQQYATMNNGVGSGTAGVTEYQPFWQALNDAILGYINHAALPKQKMKDLITGFYCFLNVHVSRGAGSDALIGQSDAKKIFVMNGFITTVAGYALEYYDDYTPADPMATPTPTDASAPHLTADAGTIGNAWDGDAAKVDALIAEYTDVVSDVALAAAFSTTAPDASATLTPQGAWDTIFDQSNWKWFIEQFHSSMSIPPRPDS